jgi:hypothetical protein
MLRDIEQFHEPLKTEVFEDQHENIRNHQGGEKPIHDIAAFNENQRSRRDAMDKRPPRNTAVTVFPGIPIVSNGIREPPITALFDVSDAMTPSIIPVPNFSGCLDDFSWRYKTAIRGRPSDTRQYPNTYSNKR